MGSDHRWRDIMAILILWAVIITGVIILNVYESKNRKAAAAYQVPRKEKTHKPQQNKVTPKEIDTIIQSTIKTTTINDWQVINKHGFSFNKMYKPNPNYNPDDKDSKPLKKTVDYCIWINETLKLMEQLKIKSLEEINVDPNRPMKIEVEFKLKHGCDTDNPIKAFLDVLQRYYELKDDNNFYVVNISRDFVCAKDDNDGRIKFRITNIEKNKTTGEITEVKIIKEKVEVVKTVTRNVDNKHLGYYEKEVSRLTIDNKRKEAKINELKKQLETISKDEVKMPKEVVRIVEVPKEIIKEVKVEVPKIITKEIVKEVIKEVEVVREVAKGDSRYKILYEKYKVAYEACKEENEILRNEIKNPAQMNYNNKSNGFIKTDAYKQQLERIKQMKDSYQ